MPELPEVETVVRQLRSKLNGKTVTKVEIFDQKVVPINILEKLPFTIRDVTRRGKFIVVDLENGDHLYVHLRMSGHFYHLSDLKKESYYKKYCTALLHLDNGSFLSYNSVRRFGHVWYVDSQELEKELAKLGCEALEMSQDEFVQTISRYKNANIKNKLLDQSFIAGVGNIYAQEALYFAAIHPLSLVSQVPEEKLASLHTHLQRILKLSIENNGTTVYNYAHIDGRGDFQNLLAVYTKKLCPQGHQIEKLKIAGRGTYFCLRCQKRDVTKAKRES